LIPNRAASYSITTYASVSLADDRFGLARKTSRHDRFGDETQVRDQAVLAADRVASKQPAARGAWERKRRRRPKSVLPQTTTERLGGVAAPVV
jgi:hypothetical protein